MPKLYYSSAWSSAMVAVAKQIKTIFDNKGQNLTLNIDAKSLWCCA